MDRGWLIGADFHTHEAIYTMLSPLTIVMELAILYTARQAGRINSVSSKDRPRAALTPSPAVSPTPTSSFSTGRSGTVGAVADDAQPLPKALPTESCIEDGVRIVGWRL